MRIALIALASVAGRRARHRPSCGHDDEQYRVQRRPISELAQESVVRLVTQAKLPASWSKAKAVKSEVRTKGGG